MDYLSFLAMQKRGKTVSVDGLQDCIVLNSVANLSKTSELLGGYGHIRCFLDNDAAGREAVKELLGKYGNRVHDESGIYGGYKDLNEFLYRGMSAIIL